MTEHLLLAVVHWWERLHGTLAPAACTAQPPGGLSKGSTIFCGCGNLDPGCDLCYTTNTFCTPQSFSTSLVTLRCSHMEWLHYQTPLEQKQRRGCAMSFFVSSFVIQSLFGREIPVDAHKSSKTACPNPILLRIGTCASSALSPGNDTPQRLRYPCRKSI
jgi:hypothetical protein